MFVELVGDDVADLRVRADALLAAAGASDGFVVPDAAEAMALWKIREDGAGLASISLARPAYPGLGGRGGAGGAPRLIPARLRPATC